MIWTSVPLMTVFDILIVAVAAYSLAVLLRWRTRMAQPEVAIGFISIVSGLTLIALFYLADLLMMHALPWITTPIRAMAVMRDMHLNYSWFIVLLGVTSITFGFSSLGKHMLVLVESLQASESRLDKEFTERASMERELGESEQRFRAFFANVPSFIYQKDRELRLTHFNDHYRRFSGLEENELIGKSASDLFPPDMVCGVDKEDRDILANGTVLNKEIDLTLRDGTLRRSVEVKFPIYGADGQIAGIGGINTDITDLKLAHDALMEQGELLGNVISNIPNSVFWKDRDLVYLGCNEQFASLAGLDSPSDIVGKTDFDLLWIDEDSERYRSYDRDVIDTGRPMLNFEETQVRPDGTTHIQLTSKVPLRNVAGEIAGVLGIFTDITERKQAEDGLARSEVRFRDIAEIASDWIWEMDSELRFSWISPRVEEVLGWRAEYYLGKTREELGFPEEGHADWQRHMETLKAHQPFRDVSLRREHDGRVRHIVLNGKPRFDADGGFLGYRGTGRDMTTEVEAREEASRVQDQFMAAIDNVPDGVALFDSDERLVLCNQSYRPHEGSMENVLVPGVTFEEFLRTRIRLGRVPEEAKGREEEWIQRRIEHFRQGASMFETHYGDQWFQVRDERLSDGSTISIASNVTELKHHEDALRQAQKMEAVGQLTGGVAHDFNNLLAVILGNAEFLGERITDEEGLVQKIIHAASRGADLTRRLLAFSRRQPLQTNVTDVDALISDMLDLLRRTLGETIEIKMEKCAEPWNIEIDPAQMESAILNIAINARDAMPKGGTLEIEIANVALAQSNVAGHDGCSPGDYVRLAMVDTGIGMTPEVLEHAFEPFFTTKDVGEGSGLGLSMIYGFVRQSGGFVEIDSEPGHGCAVRLYLPRSTEGNDAVAANDTDAIELRPPSGTVLVVEDDPDVRDLVIRFLTDLGFATVEAEDGASALARLKDNSDIDLLFADVVLPGGMSGPEIAREAQNLRTDLKIVFTSGYPDREIPNMVWEGERPQIVSKPYTRAKLVEALSNAKILPSRINASD